MITLKQRWLVVSKYLGGFYLFWVLLGYVLGISGVQIFLLGGMVLIVLQIFRSRAGIIILLILASAGFGHYRRILIKEENLLNRKNASELIGTQNDLKVKVIGEKAPVEGSYEYLGKVQAAEDKKYGYIEFTLPRYPEFRHGDLLELKGYFRKPVNSEKLNFDYVAYLERKEIFITAKVRRATKVSESDLMYDKFLRVTYNLKEILTREIASSLPEPHASLLSGILFGVRAALPEEFSDQLRITGTTHVVAISGYNMTIIIEFVKKRGKKFFGKFSDYLAGLFVCWFGLMTGMSPPVERAVVSAVQGIFVKKLGMKLEAGPSIVNTALVMLLIDPKLLQSISFLLSFAAVIGLIYWVPVLKRFIQFIPESLEDGSLVTLGALIATLPISLYFFGTFSLLALPVNFLIGPLVGIIMSLGFVALFAGLFDAILPVFNWLYYLTWVPLDLFINVVKQAYHSKFLYLSFEGLDKSSINLMAFGLLILQIVVLFLFSPIKEETLPRNL